jgi:hypothetical protein
MGRILVLRLMLDKDMDANQIQDTADNIFQTAFDDELVVGGDYVIEDDSSLEEMG